MRAAVLLCALAASPALASLSPGEYTSAFAAWKATAGRVYPSGDEEAMRFAIFSANLDKIAAHNAKGLSYTMGMNNFGDLTPAEFAAGHTGSLLPRRLRRPLNAEIVVAAPSSAVDLPNEVDWVKKGDVTSVKNQGQCGSCWAFTAVAVAESINAINGHGLIELSVQQVMDCDTTDQGCNGGLPDNAFKYIIQNGLCTAKDYPYTGEQGTCKKCKPVAHYKSFTDVKVNDDIAFATALAQQPITVAIEADQSAFQFYSSGIVTGPCGTELDHTLTAVGYGTLSGVEYYKFQNQWGTAWGMEGYVLIARGEKYNSGAGECGIYSTASYISQ